MFKSVAVLAAVTVSTVNALAAAPNLCSPSEIIKLTPLLISNGDDIGACEADSGFTLLLPAERPTDDQLAAMCASQYCRNLAAAVRKTDPGDCILSFSNDEHGVNLKELADTFALACPAVDA